MSASVAIGSLLDGRYRILRPIGQGGQSRVYLARNERTDREYAIKELRRDVADADLARRGFLAELALLKKLRHPCLPEIVDVIETDPASPLIVMDYVEGRPLSDILREEGAQPPDRAVAWMLPLCDVLSYFHAQHPPIIYRDLKPGNIILRDGGGISLIDFGTAFAATGADSIVSLGTPGYAAPEQFGLGGRIGPATDLYGLGATLCALLTGQQPPKQPEDYTALLAAEASLSKSLREIVDRCVRKDPRHRYRSAAEVKHALLRYKARDRMLRLKAFAARSLLAASVAACAALAILLGILAAARLSKAKEPSAEAREETESGQVDFYLDLAERIQENTPELLEAGMEEEDLEEVMRYILRELEEEQGE